MKHIKMMMVIAITTTALTACFNDDDDNSQTNEFKALTESEQIFVLQQLSGEYQTNIFFTNANTQKTDSALVTWTMNPIDSTATCNDFPVDILKNYVISEDAKATLDKIGRRPITFKFVTDAYVYKERYEQGLFSYTLVYPEDQATFYAEGNSGEYVSIEFATQFTSATVVYTQMIQLYKKKIYGGLLISIVDANKIASRVNLILPFQTPNYDSK